MVKLADLLKYEKLFWERFWRNTKRSVTEYLRMEVILAFFGFVGGFLVHDQNALSGFMGALAILGAVLLCIVVNNLVTVPTEIYAEQSSIIKQLSDDKKALINDSKPRLEFVFEPGVEPFEHTEPALTTGKSLRLFRIAVRNSGGQRLGNCSLKLCEMTNTTNVFLPIALKQRNDNPPRQPLPLTPSSKPMPIFLQRLIIPDNFQQTFSLNPKDIEYFDVVRLDERSETTELELCYARSPQAIPRMIPRGEYKLMLRAFADLGSESEAVFSVSVQDGTLRFERKN